VTDTNVAEALGAADGVIVSTSLMRREAGSEDVLRWDRDLTRRFMDAARAAQQHRA
jgi:predicted TIM-barrel enzyme